MSYPGNRTLARKGSQRVLENSEDVLDWENHVVLRVPPDVTNHVNAILDSDTKSRGELAVQFTSSDMRHATVRLGQRLMSAKLYDLPCVSEVTKTVDRKNFYKVADVSQIMVCSHDMSEHALAAQASASDEHSKHAKKELKQWQYPHGLTPPMKSVRRRRFRKTKKKKYMDAPEVEKELKRLLRADLDAESVRWEVIEVDTIRKPDGKELSDHSLFGDKVTSSEDEEAPPKQELEEKED